MLLEILKESMKNKKIVSIYTNKEETSKFSVGYIIGVDDNYYIIALISPSGMYDGYRIALISDIYRIAYDGKYENSIQQLYNYKNQTHTTINLSKSNLINNFIDFAKEKKLVITLELCNSEAMDVQGYVKELKEREVYINCIDSYGESDGDSVIDLESVSLIVCDSEDESILKTMSQMNQE